MDKITILNAVDCQAEATVEVAKTLSVDQQDMICRAESMGAKKRLRILASAEVGSADVTIDTISGSIDGTNFVILQAFTGLQITAAGEAKCTNPLLMEITAPLVGMTKLRLDATAAALDGSNHITLLAELLLANLCN
ncbi:MAG: hypothetical protein WC100_03385 [Sterolibacterium sp.]